MQQETDWLNFPLLLRTADKAYWLDTDLVYY